MYTSTFPQSPLLLLPSSSHYISHYFIVVDCGCSAFRITQKDKTWHGLCVCASIAKTLRIHSEATGCCCCCCCCRCLQTFNNIARIKSIKYCALLMRGPNRHADIAVHEKDLTRGDIFTVHAHVLSVRIFGEVEFLISK